jgi:hypothetical protein
LIIKDKTMGYTILNFPLTSPLIIGADISSYQANRTSSPVIHFDFDSFLERGGKFLKIRWTVAASGTDYEAEYNIEKAIEKKIPFSLTGYAKMWKNIKTQVTHFTTGIQQYMDNPYFIGADWDIEDNDGLSKQEFGGNAEKLVKQTLETLGRDPGLGIYTRASFWDVNTYRSDWPKKLRLWVAHHFPNIDPLKTPTVRPYIPKDWGDINKPVPPTFWQFDVHNHGYEWGSRGDDQIDLNWFTWDSGTVGAFISLFGVEPPGDIFEHPPGPKLVEVVKPTNLRSQPVIVTETAVSLLPVGQQIEFAGEMDNWYQVLLYVWKTNCKTVGSGEV